MRWLHLTGSFPWPDQNRNPCCRPPSARALDPLEIAAAALAVGLAPEVVEVVDEVPAALARAGAVTEPDGQIVVTGSLYTVGAARAALHASTPPAP